MFPFFSTYTIIILWAPLKVFESILMGVSNIHFVFIKESEKIMGLWRNHTIIYFSIIWSPGINKIHVCTFNLFCRINGHCCGRPHDVKQLILKISKLHCIIWVASILKQKEQEVFLWSMWQVYIYQICKACGTWPANWPCSDHAMDKHNISRTIRAITLQTYKKEFIT